MDNEDTTKADHSQGFYILPVNGSNLISSYITNEYLNPVLKAE